MQVTLNAFLKENGNREKKQSLYTKIVVVKKCRCRLLNFRANVSAESAVYFSRKAPWDLPGVYL